MDAVDEGLETAPPFVRIRNLLQPGPEDRDIAAGHEVVSGAPDDDAPYRLVRRRRLGHGLKRVRHLAVDSVQGLGPRERNRAYAVRDGGVDGIVGRADHVGSSREVSGRGRADGMYEAEEPAARAGPFRLEGSGGSSDCGTFARGCRPEDTPALSRGERGRRGAAVRPPPSRLREGPGEGGLGRYEPTAAVPYPVIVGLRRP